MDLPKLYSASQVAKKLRSYAARGRRRPTGKVDARQVRRLAKAYGVGTRADGRWVFTDADIEVLRDRPGPGRPPTPPEE